MKNLVFYFCIAGTFFMYSCQKDPIDDNNEEEPRSSINRVLPTDNPFIKGPQVVETLYPVNINQFNNDEKLALKTLQGLVARTSTTQLYFYSEQDNFYYPPDDEDNPVTRTSSLLIRHYLTTKENNPLTEVPTPSENLWDIIDYFKTSISGYVIYDNSGNDMYRNIAVTYASILNCIPIKSDMEKDAGDHGLTKMGDANQFTSYLDFINQSKDFISPHFAMELDPGPGLTDDGPRDYAAMLGGGVFWAPGDANTRTSILDAIMTDGTPALPVYGWDNKDAIEAIQEYNFLNSVSLTGNFVVASDHSANMSLLSSTNTSPVKIPETGTNELVYDDTKIYVSFVMSDGDNLQLMTNNLNTKVWYGSPHRGEFPMGWTLPPAMYYLQPDVWNFIMSRASDNDEFLIGPSTIGYVMGNATNNMAGFNAQIEYINTFLTQSGMKLGMVFGDHVKTPDDYTGNYGYLGGIAGSDLDGVFYRAYGGNNRWLEHTFYSGKPVACFNFEISPTSDIALHDQADNIAQMFRGMIANPPGDTNNGFYAIYGVRNFKEGTDFFTRDLMGAFNDLYNLIQTMINSTYKDKVVVVKPSQFIDLMKQAYQQDPGKWKSR